MQTLDAKWNKIVKIGPGIVHKNIEKKLGRSSEVLASSTKTAVSRDLPHLLETEHTLFVS